MAGMAANLSSFNTVFAYDIWQAYVRKDRPDGCYLSVGRQVTVIATVLAIGTAFIASAYANLQQLFLLLQRAAVRHVHPRPVLAADDAGRSLERPGQRHSGAQHHLLGRQGDHGNRRPGVPPRSTSGSSSPCCSACTVW
jgi:hypothetical protein